MCYVVEKGWCFQATQQETPTAPSLDELHAQDEDESELIKDPKKVC